MKKDLDPDPYLWLIDPVPNPGGPKTFETLLYVILDQTLKEWCFRHQEKWRVCVTHWFPSSRKTLSPGQQLLLPMFRCWMYLLNPAPFLVFGTDGNNNTAFFLLSAMQTFRTDRFSSCLFCDGKVWLGSGSALVLLPDPDSGLDPHWG